RAMDSRRGLLACLQQVFPVVFEGRQAGELGDLDGVLVLDPAHLDEPHVEELSTGVRVLVTPSSTSETGGATAAFGSGQRVGRALWGRGLIEAGAHGRPALALMDRDAALATIDGRPVGGCRTETELHVSAFPTEELEPGETLREHLRPGRFMGLVPLLHLLRDVCEGHGWSEEPLQASFVIDDPNLHWPSYGF